MSPHPRLSVLMPSYNVSDYITEAIDSILNQTYSDFELIIADDGSTDNTRAIIDSYTDSRIITSHNSANQGKTNTVNRLFREAKGEFVTVHDADDISLPDRFRIQVRKFENDPLLVLCGTNFISIDIGGKEFGRSHLQTSSTEIKTRLFFNSQFHGPTIIFRKNFADKLGEIYRPFFRDYNEDYDFSFRLSEFGLVTNCEEHLYMYRLTPNSLSRKLTVQKRVSTKLVQHLATQRRDLGSDDLMLGNSVSFEKRLHDLSSRYRDDKSLIYREQAELDFFYGFYAKAFGISLRAIVSNPLKFSNYRLVQHIIRKRIFGI